MEEWLTLKEVSKLLKLHTNTLYTHIKSGNLKGVKIGGVWRVKKEELDKFLDRNAYALVK